MANFSQVIFICTGNTCRSPMAEGLFRKLYADLDIDVSSRGLMVFMELPANELAIEVMEERDIDISNHQSYHYDEDDWDENSLILTMTYGHKEILQQHGYKGEVNTLKEFVGLKGDVKDPYGGDLETYRYCANEIEELIEKLGGYIK